MALKIDRDETTSDVLNGCLAGFVCMVALTLLVFISLSWLAPDLPASLQQVVKLVIWLIGTAIAGYVAARRTKSGRYKEPVYVGLLALFLVLARLPEVPDGDFIDSLHAILRDPAAHWRHFLGMILTVPIALVGGLIFHWGRKECGPVSNAD